jgi:uncharacterized protein YprB with RNaseH-like and TPR domain
MIFFDIETTGLEAFNHRVLTIQWKSGGDVTMLKAWESDEPTILVAFVKFLESVSKNETIFGYNVLKFDVPFIVERLRQHGLMTAEMHRMIHDRKWFDLYQFQGDNYWSMDAWCQAFGIQRACAVKGYEIPLLYEGKRFREIEEHAVDDLNICEQLVGKLKVEYPDIFRMY